MAMRSLLVILATIAHGATLSGQGLQTPSTFAVQELTRENYFNIDGVPIDVKVFRPQGHSPVNAPALIYSPGGGSGRNGVISEPVQHDRLWRELCGAGLTIIYLQNERENGPNRNFWQLRSDAALWVLANTSQLNSDFSTTLGPQSPIIASGWSLGAATSIQLIGADFGFGNFASANFVGALLFASPGLDSFGGVVTAAGLRQVDRPALCVFGTDDLGQPGSFMVGDPPAGSPRGLAVQELLESASPLIGAICLRDSNHFDYGSRIPTAGTLADRRVTYLNSIIFQFCDELLDPPTSCASFSDSRWISDDFVAWSAQKCDVLGLTIGGAGCATGGSLPAVATLGGAPVLGNASFAVALDRVPAGAAVILMYDFVAKPDFVGTALSGTPDCARFHLFELDGSFLLQTDALGLLNFPIPLPQEPGLMGLEAALQFAIFNPADPAFAGLTLPFGTSPALSFVIR